MKFLCTLTATRLLLVLPLLFLLTLKSAAHTATGNTRHTDAAKSATENCTLSDNNISGNQTLCSGQFAQQLNGSMPTGGDGTYSYRWESSTTGSANGFIAAAGQNDSQKYNPGNLTQTTWFRRVVLSGSCMLISEAVMLTVMPPLAASVQTSGPTAICSGKGVNLTASASYADPELTYQWLRDNVKLPGAVSATYYATEAGLYQLEVSSSGCSAVSETVAVTLLPPLEASIDVSGPTHTCSADKVTLTANVTSTASGLSYQWLRNKVPFDGAIEASFAIPGPGLYHPEVRSADCRTITEPVLITIPDYPAQPGPIAGNTSVCAGEMLSYSITAYKPDLRYVWTVPEGYNIEQGQGTGKLVVKAGNAGGIIAVASYNICDSMSVSKLNVTVDPACAPLSLTKEGASAALQLYPNPASTCLHVELPLQKAGSVTLQINTVTGKLVYIKERGRATGTFSDQISLKDLPDGLYQVKLITENSIFTKRFVKQ